MIHKLNNTGSNTKQEQMLSNTPKKGNNLKLFFFFQILLQSEKKHQHKEFAEVGSQVSYAVK